MSRLSRLFNPRAEARRPMPLEAMSREDRAFWNELARRREARKEAVS